MSLIQLGGVASEISISFLLTVALASRWFRAIRERKTYPRRRGGISVHMYFYLYTYSSYYRSIRQDPYWT